MKITSKYNGKCTACKEPVRKGMQVNWVKGVRGVTHVDCDDPEKDMAAEPENFAFGHAEPKKGTVAMTFDLTTMTVEQLNALKAIVEMEVAKRSEKKAA